EIANAFRDATIGVAAACPASRETNLVRVDTFHETEDKDPLNRSKHLNMLWMLITRALTEK
ncbi:27877_t:CDS:1, partial [Gigaspora margarita]